MITQAVQPLLRTLRVLELGHFVAAPFATRVLADLGADVIKVEPPGAGDPARSWGLQIDGRSVWWSVHGRNKRSVTLNLKEPAARALVLRLVAHCDVVIENYRAGQLDKWGLGPAELAKARPGIVVVRISGYGQTGPEAAKPGFGVIGEAKGGLRYLCAYPPEVSPLPPVRMGISLGDSVSGLYGAIGALAAVIDQRASGTVEPRVIDVALGESVLSLLEGCLPEYSLSGKIREPMGSGIATAAPTNAYLCSDGGWLLIAANSDPLFRALAKAMGQPALADDARFVDNPARVANARELDRLIGVWTAAMTMDQALTLVEAAGVPSSKIATIADVAADPQYRARGMVTEISDPVLGPLLHPGVVPVVEGQDRNAQIRWTGPSVGQHTAEVLGGLLGVTPDELNALAKRGIT